MRLTNMPLWVQRTYWYFHGPVTSAHIGSAHMGATGIVWFLAIEFVLGCVIVLAWIGIDWFGVSGQLNKILKAIVLVLIGAIMLIKLLNFAGAA
jgi:hypothetical protein